MDKFLGIFVSVAGLSFSIIVPLALDGLTWGSRLFFFCFGMVWFVMGLMVHGIADRIYACLSRHWPFLEKLNCGVILGGIGTFGIGTLLMLVSIYDPREDAFPTGRGVVFAAGIVFFLSGVAAFLPLLMKGNEQTTLQMVVSSMLITAFLSIPVMISLHEGALSFSGSIVFLGALAFMGWRNTVERIVPDQYRRRKVYAVIFILLATLFHFQDRFLQKDVPGGARWRPESTGFELSHETIHRGAKFTVTFDRILTWPEDYSYWISVNPVSPEGQGGGYMQYIRRDCQEVTLQAPDRAGTFEVRLNADLMNVLCRRTMVVTPVDEVNPERISAETGE